MIRHGSIQTSYTVVEDNIEAYFSSIGTKTESISFTIEGASNFIKELNDQIVKAKEARIHIIEKEMTSMALDICKKQEYMGKRENDLKKLREDLDRHNNAISNGNDSAVKGTAS